MGRSKFVNLQSMAVAKHILGFHDQRHSEFLRFREDIERRHISLLEESDAGSSRSHTVLSTSQTYSAQSPSRLSIVSKKALRKAPNTVTKELKDFAASHPALSRFRSHIISDYNVDETLHNMLRHSLDYVVAVTVRNAVNRKSGKVKRKSSSSSESATSDDSESDEDYKDGGTESEASPDEYEVPETPEARMPKRAQNPPSSFRKGLFHEEDVQGDTYTNKPSCRDQQSYNNPWLERKRDLRDLTPPPSSNSNHKEKKLRNANGSKIVTSRAQNGKETNLQYGHGNPSYTQTFTNNSACICACMKKPSNASARGQDEVLYLGQNQKASTSITVGRTHKTAKSSISLSSSQYDRTSQRRRPKFSVIVPVTSPQKRKQDLTDSEEERCAARLRKKSLRKQPRHRYANDDDTDLEFYIFEDESLDNED